MLRILDVTVLDMYVSLLRHGIKSGGLAADATASTDTKQADGIYLGSQ